MEWSRMMQSVLTNLLEESGRRPTRGVGAPPGRDPCRVYGAVGRGRGGAPEDRDLQWHGEERIEGLRIRKLSFSPSRTTASLPIW